MPKVSKYRYFVLYQNSSRISSKQIELLHDALFAIQESYRMRNTSETVSYNTFPVRIIRIVTLLPSKFRQPLFLEQCSSKIQNLKKFSIYLFAALTQAEIPLNKVNHQAFKGFLEKYTQISLPDERTLRKNLY